MSALSLIRALAATVAADALSSAPGRARCADAGFPLPAPAQKALHPHDDDVLTYGFESKEKLERKRPDLT